MLVPWEDDNENFPNRDIQCFSTALFSLRWPLQWPRPDVFKTEAMHCRRGCDSATKIHTHTHTFSVKTCLLWLRILNFIMTMIQLEIFSRWLYTGFAWNIRSPTGRAWPFRCWVPRTSSLRWAKGVLALKEGKDFVSGIWPTWEKRKIRLTLFLSSWQAKTTGNMRTPRWFRIPHNRCGD